MRAVPRSAIVDAETYETRRADFRRLVMAEKARRRIHVGDHLTFLFENPLTMQYQVQELVRTERITREDDIQHELATYNALLGAAGELACTLLIEIDDPAARAVRLREWYRLPEHVYVRLAGGRRARAVFDESQRGQGRVSSVQYLKFPVGGDVPVAVGVDLPGLEAETPLTAEQQAALAADLHGAETRASTTGSPPSTIETPTSSRETQTMTPNIGINEQNRRAVAEILGRVLADEYVLYTKTRNFHWNVVGLQFAPLHEFFEKQYEKLNDIIDEVAERVRMLGLPAAGTLTEFVKQARLAEQPGEYPAAETMVQRLLADHEAIVRELRGDVSACADEHGDIGTSDFLTGILEDHEKMAWMLRAHLARAASA